MNIHDFLQPENVALDLVATSKSRLLQVMSDMAEIVTDVDSKAVYQALQKREKLGSTGIGEGIAIPHAPVPGLEMPFSLLIRLKNPVDFESIDEIPVDIVFLLLTPLAGSTTHLNALSCMARRLRSPGVVKAIRASTDKDTVYSMLAGDA